MIIKLRLLTASSIFVLVLSFVSGTQAQQTGPAFTFTNPIAYIGIDGNLYMTDARSGAGVAVTNDAENGLRPGESVLAALQATYSNPNWSPRSEMLVVGKTSMRLSSLILAVSGKSPTLISGDATVGVESGTPFGIWSPDGRKVGYIEDYQGRYFSIQTYDVVNGNRYTTGKFEFSLVYAHGQNDGVGFEIYVLATYEQGFHVYIFPYFSMLWTPSGFLHNVTTGFDGIYEAAFQLMDFGGRQIWIDRDIAPAVFSKDGKQGLFSGRVRGRGISRLRILDTATGRTSSTKLQGVTPLAWTADNKSIYYVTYIASENASPDCLINIWRVSLDGKGHERLISFPGNYIGKFSVSNDDKQAVFSVISARAVESSTGVPTINNGVPHTEIVHADFATGAVTRLAFGNQPAISEGTFTVAPLIP